MFVIVFRLLIPRFWFQAFGEEHIERWNETDLADENGIIGSNILFWSLKNEYGFTNIRISKTYFRVEVPDLRQIPITEKRRGYLFERWKRDRKDYGVYSYSSEYDVKNDKNCCFNLRPIPLFRISDESGR